MGLQAPCVRESVSQAEFSSPATPRTPKRRQRTAHLQADRCRLLVLEYTGPGASCTGHACAPGAVSREHLTCVHLKCQQLTQRRLPLYVQGSSALVLFALPVSVWHGSLPSLDSDLCFFFLFGSYVVRQVHARSPLPSWTSF